MKAECGGGDVGGGGVGGVGGVWECGCGEGVQMGVVVVVVVGGGGGGGVLSWAAVNGLCRTPV